MFYKKIDIVLIILLSGVMLASPVDVAYSLFDAIEYHDGYALENIFSNDLYFTLTGFLDQTRLLVQADPVLAENMLQQRYHGRITVYDVEILSNEELLGKLLSEIHLQSYEQIEQETADMTGRLATVVITYFNGSTISFRMVWEDGDWRITDTSLLATVF